MSDAATKESAGVRTRAVLWGAAGLAAMLVLALGLVAAAFRVELGTVKASGEAGALTSRSYAGPPLQVDGRGDLARFRAEEDTRLRGRAAMPIGDAMRAVVARGADALAPWPVTKPSESAR